MELRRKHSSEIFNFTKRDRIPFYSIVIVVNAAVFYLRTEHDRTYYLDTCFKYIIIFLQNYVKTIDRHFRVSYQTQIGWPCWF